MSPSMEMLKAHPKARNASASQTECIQDCSDCMHTCLTCADSCLNEDMVKDMRRCIRADLDCADICAATIRVLSRLSDAVWAVVQRQVETLAAACSACADECEKHDHEHCRICAEVCRRCESSCRELLEVSR